MMTTLNRITVRGYVREAPEVDTDGPQRFVRLVVVTTDRWLDEGGTSRQRSQGHYVVIKNPKLGDLALKHLLSGSKVEIEGMMDYRTYPDPQTGASVWTAEVVVGSKNGRVDLLESADEWRFRAQAKESA